MDRRARRACGRRQNALAAVVVGERPVLRIIWMLAHGQRWLWSGLFAGENDNANDIWIDGIFKEISSEETRPLVSTYPRHWQLALKHVKRRWRPLDAVGQHTWTRPWVYAAKILVCCNKKVLFFALFVLSRLQESTMCTCAFFLGPRMSEAYLAAEPNKPPKIEYIVER